MDFSAAEFKLKTIRYQGRETRIILQNENGPCPLIALANIMLLRGLAEIHADYGQISGDHLMTLIGEIIMSRAETATDENERYTINEAMGALPNLQTGLNVNVKFHTVHGFEPMSDAVVFDVLNIRMLHGWVIDPMDENTAQVIGQSSYNELTERLVAASAGDTSRYQDLDATSPNTKDQKLALQTFEAEVIETWLASTAHQLTWHGLAELHQNTREGELAVIFRNNHFATLVKFCDELYLLVTDAGYAEESKVVWEKLCEVGGDTSFVDSEFVLASESASVLDLPPGTFTDAQTTQDHDLMMALAMQEEEYNQTDATLLGPTTHTPPPLPNQPSPPSLHTPPQSAMVSVNTHTTTTVVQQPIPEATPMLELDFEAEQAGGPGTVMDPNRVVAGQKVKAKSEKAPPTGGQAAWGVDESGGVKQTAGKSKSAGSCCIIV